MSLPTDHGSTLTTESELGELWRRLKPGRRVVVVRPELEDLARVAVAAIDTPHDVTVKANRYVPDAWRFGLTGSRPRPPSPTTGPTATSWAGTGTARSRRSPGSQGDLFSTGVDDPVHAIYHHRVERGKKVIETKCHRITETKERPPDVTAWASDITCPECKPKACRQCEENTHGR